MEKEKLSESRRIRFSDIDIENIKRACNHLGYMKFVDFVRFATKDKAREVINNNEDLVDKLMYKFRDKKMINRLLGRD